MGSYTMVSTHPLLWAMSCLNGLLVMKYVFIMPNALWTQKKKYSQMQKQFESDSHSFSLRTQFSFTERTFSSITWFEYFKNAKSQKCNQYFTIADFFQVRFCFYEQSHWTTEMSLVFLKYIKPAKHWAPSADTRSISKHGEGIHCVTRGVLQKVLRTNLPKLLTDSFGGVGFLS